jgi:hypothetical protein
MALIYARRRQPNYNNIVIKCKYNNDANCFVNFVFSNRRSTITLNKLECTVMFRAGRTNEYKIIVYTGYTKKFPFQFHDALNYFIIY